MAGLFSVEGKTVLVTGGSRGIGLMIARGFVEAGAEVVISSRKADVCDAAWPPAPRSCEAIPADLSTVEGVDGLAAAVRERWPRLDVLVNNAGADVGRAAGVVSGERVRQAVGGQRQGGLPAHRRACCRRCAPPPAPMTRRG